MEILYRIKVHSSSDSIFGGGGGGGVHVKLTCMKTNNAIISKYIVIIKLRVKKAFVLMPSEIHIITALHV